MTAGQATDGTGGDLVLTSGEGTTASGAVSLSSGDATGTTGEVILATGSSADNSGALSIGSGTASSGNSGTVSYTHLRAHET